jgi:flagellar hook protein FlgE
MAIQGDGYFVMSDGKQDFYTRDGTFDLALDGTLASASSGLHVKGWQADPVTGLVNTASPPTNISVPLGAGMTGKASTSVTMTGNVDSNTAAAGTVALSSTVYDSLGNAVPVTFTLTKSATPDQWTISAASTSTSVTAGGVTTNPNPASVSFNASGKVNPAAAGALQSISFGLNNGATTPQTVSVDLSEITQLASTPSNLSSNTDGASAGSLTTFTVGQAGDITGVYSNGYKQPLGQISLASFANPSGLMKAGGNLFSSSANSGTANVGTPNSGGRGQIATGFLEGSNVDLAQQFTNMIMAERGFQANSKVITTSDEILQDLVNLKH